MTGLARLTCCLALAGALLQAAPATAGAPADTVPVPEKVQTIEIGTSFKLKSAALGEERTINIYLPDSYATSGRSYPVLYLIDGGLQQDFLHVVGTSQLGGAWGRSQDVIVVGVETRDRRRELVGPTADPDLLAKYPTAGKSAAFRNFIRREVMPAVAARYRINDFSGVMGESLAGLFIVETYLREPDLFDAYAAVSPSLWWDKERLSHEAARLVGARQAGKKLYIATANEGADMQKVADRLLAALRSSTEPCHIARSDLTHSTIYHAVSPQALQFLFPGDTPPDPESGFEIPCSPRS